MSQYPSATGYPVNTNVADWLNRKCGGLPASGAKIWERPVRLYDVMDVPAGTPLAPTQTEWLFFQQKRQQGVTNIDTPGSLPANYALAIRAIRLSFVFGFDRFGRRLGQAAPSVLHKAFSALNFSDMSAQAGIFQATPNAAAPNILSIITGAMETIRDFMTNSVLTFTVAEKPVFEMRCLSTFPDGRGVLPNGTNAVASNSATTGVEAQSFINPTNGVPIYGNRFEFVPPYPLPGGQNFQLKANTLRAIDWTDAVNGPLAAVAEPAGSPIIAGCIIAELEGEWASPATA